MSTTTEDLPEYAVTVADCGDPQRVIYELTEWLDEQNAPEVLTWALVRSESEQLNEDENYEFAEEESDHRAEGGSDA